MGDVIKIPVEFKKPVKIRPGDKKALLKALAQWIDGVPAYRKKNLSVDAFQNLTYVELRAVLSLVSGTHGRAYDQARSTNLNFLAQKLIEKKEGAK